ncbi:MAG TPA: peptidase M28 [Solibacterales bacterium]|nr:peptidase M28 [Bryobacterales bacterium]
MRTLWLAGICGAALLAASSDGSRWWSHVQFLADDRLEGRNTGSEGHRKAAAYVAGQFERAGLQPAGTQGYLQPVRFKTRQIDESASSLELVRGAAVEPVALGEEAVISMRQETAPATEAPLVFAGYGLTVPEAHYDDFAGLDVRGKIIVYLAGAPPSIPGPLSSHYQSSFERSANWKRLGVAGTCAIPNPKSMDIPWARSSLARFQTAMSLAEPGMDESGGTRLNITVNPVHADKLFAGTGHSIQEILDLANAGKPLPHFAIPAALRARVAAKRGELESQNVAALLRGSDPVLKNEYVVMTAHLDHLGIGEAIRGDRIYNGAMDNAAGVAAMLDIVSMLRERQFKPRRSLLFVAVTAEEKGLLGSRFFATHSHNAVADINVDMFLPLYPLKRLTVYGLDESDLGDDAREVAAARGLAVQSDPEPARNSFIRSDQYSFIRQGIPALALKDGYLKGAPEEKIFKTWLTERYHAPSDDLNQPVDRRAAGDFDEFVAALLQRVANRDSRPQWKSTSFFRRFAK